MKIHTTLGYIVSLSQVQEDKWNNITKSCVYRHFKTLLENTFTFVAFELSTTWVYVFQSHRRKDNVTVRLFIMFKVVDMSVSSA